MKKRLYFTATLSLIAASLMATGCSENEIPTDSAAAEAENSTRVDDTDMAADTESSEGFTGASAVPSDMEITFEDDFVNSTGIPDPDKWVLCKRATSDWARYLSESYDQAYTKDGILYLVGEQKDGEYLTAGIETRGKFDFTHGRVECRARFYRMPQGNHTGIWMMPAPPAEQWPKSGEIDIMEHLNKDDIVYETAHSWYADDMGHKDDPKSQATAEIDKEDWNIYGVEWTAEKITYTVNGKEVLSYPNLQLGGEDGAYQWPFNHPFYLILSQSLGGAGTWAGAIDNSELPAIFQVDWIRVIQPKTGSSGVPKITMDY